MLKRIPDMTFYLIFWKYILDYIIWFFYEDRMQFEGEMGAIFNRSTAYVQTPILIQLSICCIFYA